MALQRDLWSVNQAFSRFNLAAAVKVGLKLQGFDCGDPAPPQTKLSAAEVEVVRKALVRVGALYPGLFTRVPDLVGGHGLNCGCGV